MDNPLSWVAIDDHVYSETVDTWRRAFNILHFNKEMNALTKASMYTMHLNLTCEVRSNREKHSFKRHHNDKIQWSYYTFSSRRISI